MPGPRSPLPRLRGAGIAVIDQFQDGADAEVLAAFQETAKTAFPVPKTPYWIEATNLIYPELQAAILGDKTVDEALQTARSVAEHLATRWGQSSEANTGCSTGACSLAGNYLPDNSH